MSHAISRRSFVQLLFAGAATTLAACAPAAPGAAPTSAPAAAQPKAGAGSAPDEAQLIEAAKRDGKVVLYTNQDPAQADNTLKTLQSRFGLDAHVERLTSTDLNQRYAAEADAGKFAADIVVTGGFDFTNSAQSKGWFANIEALPALSAWPPQFWNGRVAIAGFLALGIARNTNLVKDEDAPKTWQDLLDPKFKNQIILIDPHTAGGPDYWLWLMRDKFGEDYIRKLGEQTPRFQASAPAALQALSAGAGKVAIPVIRNSTESLIAQGAPLTHTLPAPTTGGTTLIAVSAKAEHPDAARLVLNFFLSPDGQQMLNQNGYSPLPGLSGVSVLPDDYVAADQTKAKAAMPEIFGLMGLKY